MPAATRTVVQQEHKQQQEEFNLYTFVDNALRQQIIKAVPSDFIMALEDPTLGYSQTTALTIMTHLWTNYGTIDADELQFNSLALNTPTWNPSTSIESLFARIQNHVDFAAAGGAPIPDALIAQAAYSNVESTGLYPTYCDNWRAKPGQQRTWANFKTHFTTAYKDLHRLTSSSAGYHSANVVTKHDPTTEKLEIIMAELLALKIDLSAQKAAMKLPTPGSNNQRFYCHTHGISANSGHTSATCNKKGPDHKDGATLRNKMGGSTRDWKPRT